MAPKLYDNCEAGFTLKSQEVSKGTMAHHSAACKSPRVGELIQVTRKGSWDLAANSFVVRVIAAVVPLSRTTKILLEAVVHA